MKNIFRTILSEESIYLMEYNGESEHVVIPDSIEGKTVVKIFSSCFSYNNKIESVVIPKSIETIDERAFSNCENLKKVTILNENIKIDKEAFNECNNIESIDYFSYKFLSPKQLYNIIAKKLESGGFTNEEEKVILFCIRRKPSLKNLLLSSINASAVSFILDTDIKLILYKFNEYLQYHIENENTAIVAIFLEYKKNNFTQQEIDDFNENKELVEIGLVQPNYMQLKEKWKVKVIKEIYLPTDEVVNTLMVSSILDKYITITGYKGNEKVVTIPSYVLGEGLVPVISSTSGGCNFNPIENLTIQEGVEVIGYYAFYLCTSLTSISLPNTIVRIDANAFEFCNNLEEIEIPDSVKYINSLAFNNCTKLKKVVLPKTLEEIRRQCFGVCVNLQEIVIPDTVRMIQLYAFYNCQELTKIEIPNSVEVIGENAFTSCHSLKEISISNKLVILSAEVFSYCHSLEEIIIPNSVINIEIGAFYKCSKLKKITLSQKLEELGDGVFSGCCSLEEIVLPKSLKKMGSRVFANCQNLKRVVFNSKVELDDSVFDGCPNVVYNLM